MIHLTGELFEKKDARGAMLGKRWRGLREEAL